MNATPSLLQDLQSRLSDIIKSSPAAELERNLRAVVAQGMHKLDMATQEDLAEQREVLRAAHSRMQALEARIAALESNQKAKQSNA